MYKLGNDICRVVPDNLQIKKIQPQRLKDLTDLYNFDAVELGKIQRTPETLYMYNAT